MDCTYKALLIKAIMLTIISERFAIHLFQFIMTGIECLANFNKLSDLILAGWRVHGYVWHDGRYDGKRGE